MYVGNVNKMKRPFMVDRQQSQKVLDTNTLINPED